MERSRATGAGRTSAFGLAPGGFTLLDQGRERIFAPAPFSHDAAVWTFLSCPLPETLRNARYHLQTRLAWAGFGLAAPNAWIAPGRVDVAALLDALDDSAIVALTP
ncbi:hypothetical protein [Actinoplanes sp. NPDC051851]|uniref:hypothetical protein n=1 Tax=Actinoplanes sp. NPDC051851 TaxID=3154753 RepID=UPI003427B53E